MKSVTARITLISMAHLILSGVSLAQVSPQLALKAPDASAIADAAQRQGHVRIIVVVLGAKLLPINRRGTLPPSRPSRRR